LTVFRLARAALVLAAGTLVACGSPRPIVEGSRACDRCHGPGVSEAHRAHVEPGALAAGFGCDACHVVPATVAEHVGDGPKLTFGTLARTGSPPGPAPAWTRGDARCSNVYCHGATLSGGTNTTPVWTAVDSGQAACGTCHGAPPPSHAAYAGASDCHACHGLTVLADGKIDVAGRRHLNGSLDFTGGGSGLACDTCHAAPPHTGAHRAHAAGVPTAELAYGDLRSWAGFSAPGGGYAFGCGHCHPLDAAQHFADAGGDGLPDVVLAPPSPAVPGDALKARNAPGAAWSASTGTCAGVACHSSGQATPAYAPTPAWTAAPGALGCDGCHGNPPRYASGGAGAADANSHVQLQADGWEWGHTGGLPGPWHGSKHGDTPGVKDSAPITCQACHYASLAVEASGPGSFYWLDTRGDFQLPGGAAARLTSPNYARLDCTTCHAGAGPAAGAGRTDPARHVNGVRDVAFDPRTTLPALAWLPAAPDRPTQPYWVTSNVTPPAGGSFLKQGKTLSFHLAGASYDAATKTCSNVACHLAEASETWGKPHAGFQACSGCHGF